MTRCFIRKSTRCTSTMSKSPLCKISSIAASNVRCSSNVTSRANNTPKSISLSRVAVPSACEPKSQTPNTSGLLANNRLSAGNFRFSAKRKSGFILSDGSLHKLARPIVRAFPNRRGDSKSPRLCCGQNEQSKKPYPANLSRAYSKNSRTAPSGSSARKLSTTSPLSPS